MAEKGVAFLVGIDEYEDHDLLKNFIDDDRPTENIRSFINDVLEDPICQYGCQVKLTTSSEVTYDRIKQELTDFLTNRNYKDVLIYFSGHGYQIYDQSTNKYGGYLATYNSVLHKDIQDKYPYAQKNGFALTQLSKLISQATHLDKLTLLIDACHSGLAFQEGVLGAAFQCLEPTFKYCIFTSSLGSEESFGGIFSNALMQSLLNKENGPIRADDLVRNVKSKLHNAQQHPKDFSSGASSIVLMNYPVENQNQTLRQEPILDKNRELVCPYRGLKFFDDDKYQQAFFFGRERDIRKIRSRLDRSAFVPVIGASGSGKSSVVRAGLVRKQLRQAEKGKWRILPIIKPGDAPLRSLKRAFGPLLQDLEEGTAAYKAIDDFVYGASLLSLKDFEIVLEQLRSEKPYLLVIDQFEEAFTLTASEAEVEKDAKTTDRVAERDRFLELVTAVTKMDDGPLKVVVTMRAEFLGRCLTHPALKDLIEDEAVYIAPLIGTGLIDAIEQPALRQGYPITPELRDALIQDVKTEPGYLPLLLDDQGF